MCVGAVVCWLLLTPARDPLSPAAAATAATAAAGALVAAGLPSRPRQQHAIDHVQHAVGVCDVPLQYTHSVHLTTNAQPIG